MCIYIALFNKLILASVTDEWTNEWAWCIDGMILTAEKQGIRKIKEKICHFLFVHHKSYMDWPGIQPEPPRWQAGNEQPEPWQDIYYFIFTAHQHRSNPQKDKALTWWPLFQANLQSGVCLLSSAKAVSIAISGGTAQLGPLSSSILFRTARCSMRHQQEIWFRSVRRSINWQTLSLDFVPRKNMIDCPLCCLFSDCPWSLNSPIYIYIYTYTYMNGWCDWRPKEDGN